VCRGPCRLRGEEFRHVRLGPAFLLAVEEPRRLVSQQRDRLDLRVRLRERELDALIRTDRPSEDDPLRRVLGAARDEPATVADRLGRDKDAFSVPRVEDLAKALALWPDPI